MHLLLYSPARTCVDVRKRLPSDDVSLVMRFIRRTPPERRVTLYGKPGCHLCDEARDLLHRLGTRYSIQLQEVDITTDPNLFRRYDIRIPVMVIDGTIELEAPIDEQTVRRVLRRPPPDRPASRCSGPAK